MNLVSVIFGLVISAIPQFISESGYITKVQSNNIPGFKQTVEGRSFFMVAAKCHESGMAFEEKHARALAQYVQMMEDTYLIPQSVLRMISMQAQELGEEAAADSTGAECKRYLELLPAVIPGINTLYE